MGTLVGITRNLSTIDQSRIDVINANSRNEQLLVSLGIDKILSLDENNKFHNDILLMLSLIDLRRQYTRSKRRLSHQILKFEEMRNDFWK